jgi:hypothetical protein
MNKKSLQIIIDAISNLTTSEITAETMLSLSQLKTLGFPLAVVEIANEKINEYYVETVKKQERVLTGAQRVRYCPNEAVPLCYSL